jgi:DNA-binding IclR family transcriptional regulator
MVKQMHASEVDEANAETHRAPAVARAATVLRLLVGQRSGLGVTEIARRVGLVPSTCLHVLRALVDEGFITFDAKTKTYRTGVGLFTLVPDIMASREFPQAVQPYLDRLAVDHHATAIALELDSLDCLVVVAISRPSHLVSLHFNIGARFASLIGATGRCVAAVSNASREELRPRFAALPWAKAPSFEDWYADVERARMEGTAVDLGNTFRGLSMVSSLLPIGMDRGVRGIALIGFEHYMTERVLRQLTKELIDATQAVSTRLN